MTSEIGPSQVRQATVKYPWPCGPQTVSFIKDTTHFLNKLDQPWHLPSDAILVTLDLSTLHTNIPYKEGIDAGDIDLVPLKLIRFIAFPYWPCYFQVHWQTDLQAVASLRKMNLRKDLRWVANGLASFLASTRKWQKKHFKTYYPLFHWLIICYWTSLNLRWLGLGSQTVKTLL